MMKFHNPNFLLLTAVDKLFIDQFDAADDETKQQIVKRTKFDVIARISHSNLSFELFCKRIEMKDSWEQLWCAYGVVLSAQQKLDEIVFYIHPKTNPFDLVRGAYFYNLSQKINKNMKVDFTYSEMESVKLAIKYGSVHAIQRFNEFLYDKLQSARDEDKNALYNQLIMNSMGMFPDSGSYGYMVLAEGLGSYALWLLERRETLKAEQIFKKSMESLDKATLILVQSQQSIHNASLGRGLKTSNSLSINTPESAKIILNDKFELLRGELASHYPLVMSLSC